MLEGFGKRIMENFELSNFHILVGRNSYEGSVKQRNDQRWIIIRWSYDHSYFILVHGMEKNLK